MLFFLAILALFLSFLLSKPKKNETFHPPPGPKRLPIIGNLHQFDPSKPAHIFFGNLAKIYGPIVSLRLGYRTMVVVQSPKIAKQFYYEQDNSYRNRYVSLGSQKFSYNGLGVVFAPYGENYRQLKKLFVVHLLSSKRVQSFARIRHEEVSRFINKISTLSSSSNIVNLSELAMSYTTSNICRIAFGKRYEDEEGRSKSKFHELLNEAQALFADIFFTDHFPLLGSWLDKLSGKHDKLEKTFKELDAFYEEILDDHIKKPKSDDEDIIDILLQLKKEGSFGFELTMDHIKATLMDIFVAGTDTTAAMLVWAMTELIKNPKIMQKVQKELRDALQDKSDIVQDDLTNLEYFKAVIKETFRLHPPGPILIPRESLQKTELGGFDIPAKTIITINLWALGRDPESWSDPNSFKPERFLGSSKSFLGQDFELLPFGAGKRMCPGLNFGIASLELALANLLQNFNWELPSGLKIEDIDTDVQLGVIMHKKNPLCLRANKLF